MFARINHVAVVVRNAAQALRFYHDILGLPLGQQATVADQGVHAVLLPVGEDEIELLEPTNPAGGVARFLEKKGEGIHHLCLETPDVAAALLRLKTANLPVIDQTPRKGLAGTIAFLHPGACHGVLVELAQPPQGAHHASSSACGICATHVATIFVGTKDLRAAAENFARNFDAQVAGPDLDPRFGVTRMQVQLGKSHLTLLDAAELAGLPTDESFVGPRRDGVFGVCLAVADVAAAERSLGEKRIALSIRRAVSGAPLAKVHSEDTHGVDLYLCSER